MIGIFDSGVGGFNALFEIRRRLPFADILYFADEANAPYGTKSEDELINLVKKDVNLLKNMGAGEILIACCTASTVFEKLSKAEKQGLTPIISPAAITAAKYARVAVIATEATVKSGAFSREIKKIRPDCKVFELAMQELVGEIENGSRGCKISERCGGILNELSGIVNAKEFDAIVLGCTHFSHLEAQIKNRLAGVKIVSPAREGAMALINKIKDKNDSFCQGHGKTVYIRS